MVAFSLSMFVLDASASELDYSVKGTAVPITGAVNSISQIKACNDNPDIVCRNLMADDVQAEFVCTADRSNGGWLAQNIHGNCFKSLDVCRKIRDAKGNVIREKCTSLETKAQASSISINPYSRCNKTSVGKNHCTWKADGLTGNTGDDMFRISPTGTGFLEYVALGSMSDQDRLKWFKRDDDKKLDMMIPSGPGKTYSDYRRFISNPHPTVSVKDACYPANVSFCGNIDFPEICSPVTLNDFLGFNKF